MKLANIKLALFTALLALPLASHPVAAKPGNAENGEKIYVKRCLMCHGEEGEGDGPGADRLNPPPRDFTLGQYKIKSTAFDDDVPNDSDIYRMISDGMPGTAMPGWSDVLKEQEMWDLVEYLKAFAEIEDPASKQVSYGTQIATSPESIAKGKTLFHDGDLCSECHGVDGKGDAIKKLKGDNSERTWPRNLTKPETFRGSNTPKDIFARVTVGIPGTQMPSFDNPKSKKRLSIEDRWHVSNYAASLVDTIRAVDAAKTVITAAKVEGGGVPDSPDDPRWAGVAPVSFALVPQIIAKQRFFTPTNDTVSVRALFDETAVSLLLEWDDRTKSIPGDAKAKELSEAGLAEDMIALQFPVTIPDGVEKPYFMMGDATHPVNLWKWRSGTTDQSEAVSLIDATGVETQSERDAAAAGLSAKGIYKDGTWRVVMKRPLSTDDAENDIQFTEGRFIPVAFFNWDGSNTEQGTKHTITTWYWLLLEPPKSMDPYLYALLVLLLIGAGEVWWVRSANKNKTDQGET